MATEKIVQMNKTDVIANGTELVLESMAQFDKVREEVQKLTRDGIEKTNALVRAAGQTALDLYDFNVRMTETLFSMTEDSIRNASGIARKVQQHAQAKVA